ncbi:MAG: iron chaperone [Bacteroidia bacterium]
METPKTKFETADEYLATVPEHIKPHLEELRSIIKQSAPDAKEVISYNMPAYKMNKVLVYFAAGKNHIGFYPTPNAVVAFKDELKEYKTSKGAVQFPIEKGIPKTLVKKIVAFRIKEDKELAKAKKK